MDLVKSWQVVNIVTPYPATLADISNPIVRFENHQRTSALPYLAKVVYLEESPHLMSSILLIYMKNI